jgi:hypothetical protein
MEDALPALERILEPLAPPQAMSWLRGVLARQESGFELRPFYYAFSGATRHFPKVPVENAVLRLGSVPDFSPRRWTLDQVARTILLLSLARQGKDVFLGTYAALHDTADIRESVALHAALPLLPHPQDLVPHAREGLRSNIVDVFDAVALHNPFPAAWFDNAGWNQMILKCLFIRRPLFRVVGVDRRANAALAQALSDLAHERWAANRPVSPELWRSCARFASPALADDLGRVLALGGPGQREAVALAVAADVPGGPLEALRDPVADLVAEIAAGRLSWDGLGQSLEGS